MRSLFMNPKLSLSIWREQIIAAPSALFGRCCECWEEQSCSLTPAQHCPLPVRSSTRGHCVWALGVCALLELFVEACES